MRKIVILLPLLICGSNAILIDDTGVSNRISNGYEESIAHHAYMVSIQEVALAATSTRGHKCGGAAITLKHILTAAMCAFRENNGNYVRMNATEFRVFAGASLLSSDSDPNRNIRDVANITVHQEYILPPASLNDIAVFILAAEYLNTTVSPIALPSPDFDPEDFTLCTIASWGARLFNETASNELRATTKYIYNQGLCKSIYSQFSGQLNVFPSMICAASFDIISSGCVGDEGIPLVCRGGLAGIMFRTNNCAASSFPEVYTRISNYTVWIRTISGTAAFRPEFTYFGVLAVVINLLIKS